VIWNPVNHRARSRQYVPVCSWSSPDTPSRPLSSKRSLHTRFEGMLASLPLWHPRSILNMRPICIWHTSLGAIVGRGDHSNVRNLAAVWQFSEFRIWVHGFVLCLSYLQRDVTFTTKLWPQAGREAFIYSSLHPLVKQLMFGVLAPTTPNIALRTKDTTLHFQAASTPNPAGREVEQYVVQTITWFQTVAHKNIP